MATVMASAAFGAASGSTIVNAAVFTRMAMPEMTRFGYDVRLSAGCIAAAGTLAALIPPSILMVIYGVITEQSIGKLLIAGIVPGIVTALLYCGGIYVLARWRPDLAPLRQDQRHLGESGCARCTAFPESSSSSCIVVGGIYGGYFPATYAGAVGAFGAFVIAFAKRRLGMRLPHGGPEGGGGHHLGDLHHRGRRNAVRALPHLFRAGDDHLRRRCSSLGTGKYTYLVGYVVLFTHPRLLHRADRDHGDDPADHVPGDARRRASTRYGSAWSPSSSPRSGCSRRRSG